jgi:hypothetical protein
MKNIDESEAVEVFAGTIWQAEMVKSLLNDEGIEAYLKDEVIGTMFPWMAAAGGSRPMTIVVSGEDADKALSIIERYESNLKSDS